MIVPEDSSLSRGRSSSKPRPVVSGLVVAFVLAQVCTLALVAVRSVSSASGPAIKIDAARVPPEKVRSLLALADVDASTTEKVLRLAGAESESYIEEGESYVLGDLALTLSEFPLHCIENGYKVSIYDQLPEKMVLFGHAVTIRCEICRCPDSGFAWYVYWPECA